MSEGSAGGDKGRRKAGYVGHGEESGRETEARVSQQRCEPCQPAARARRLCLRDTGWPVNHSAWRDESSGQRQASTESRRKVLGSGPTRGRPAGT